MRILRHPWPARVLAVVVAAYLLWGLVAGVVAAWQQSGPVLAAVILVLHAAALAALGVVLADCPPAVLLAQRRPPATDGAAPARAPLGAVATCVLLGLAAVIALVMNALVDFAGTGILFAVVWLAPFRLRLAWAVGGGVLVTAASVAGGMTTGLLAPVTFGIAAGLGWALFLAAVLAQLAETRRQSAAVAAARAREAVLGERQRLAREIHDVLAHSLSAQVVHLEGARLLLERGDTDAALEQVASAGKLARMGLEETKRAVAALRDDQAPLAEELERLAAGFRAATGETCAVTVDGDPGGLRPESRLAVVRTAQEALTNVHKHAPGAKVTLQLTCRADWCELEVRDSGGDTGELAGAGSGWGLVGMRERAELIGGTLDARPADDGFRVHLRVPS